MKKITIFILLLSIFSFFKNALASDNFLTELERKKDTKHSRMKKMFGNGSKSPRSSR